MRKYANFEGLTNTMLNEFVYKILVHERDIKGSVDSPQTIEFYFNFIGKFEAPATEQGPTPSAVPPPAFTATSPRSTPLTKPESTEKAEVYPLIYMCIKITSAENDGVDLILYVPLSP